MRAESGANGNWTVGALALAFLVLVATPIVNMAPDMVTIALMYAAISQARFLSRQMPSLVCDHVVFCILIFGMACLRSNYLVPAFAVAASLYVALFWARPGIAIVWISLAAILLVVCMSIPWLITTYRISGTPLYPFLGFGNMSHDEVAGFTALSIFVKTSGRILLCYGLAASVLLLLWRAQQLRRELFLGVLTVLLLSLTLLSQMKYTVFGFRYAYVGIVTLPLFLFVRAIPLHLPRSRARSLVSVTAIVFVAAIFHHQVPGTLMRSPMANSTPGWPAVPVCFSRITSMPPPSRAR